MKHLFVFVFLLFTVSFARGEGFLARNLDLNLSPEVINCVAKGLEQFWYYTSEGHVDYIGIARFEIILEELLPTCFETVGTECLDHGYKGALDRHEFEHDYHCICVAHYLKRC